MREKLLFQFLVPLETSVSRLPRAATVCEVLVHIGAEMEGQGWGQASSFTAIWYIRLKRRRVFVGMLPGVTGCAQSSSEARAAAAPREGESGLRPWH